MNKFDLFFLCLKEL